jgi:hypothetical protein
MTMETAWIDGRWLVEVRAASGWWCARITEAIDRAYPPESLFGGLASELRLPEVGTKLHRRIADELNIFLGNHGELWQPFDPLKGSMYRRIEKQGRFLHPAIGLPMVDCGLGEVAEYLPDGLRCTINPGAIVVGLDRRSKDTRVEVGT